jgi:predicted nucleic acid-binding protein
MIVVADTGPIISLAILNLTNLFEDLYGEVYIPEAVWHEVEQYIDVFDIPQVQFLERSVRGLTKPNDFQEIMDIGEAEAASLYKEINADLLVIDDKTARKTAEAHDIRCIGTLAVLMDARNKGFINSLRPHFIQLLLSERYYKTTLLNSILEDYGEPALSSPLETEWNSAEEDKAWTGL